MARNRSLIFRKDGNSIEYRLDGIQLARCLVKTGHPQEHMISVVRRIREFCPELPQDLSIDNYRAARAIWDTRKEETKGV